MKRGRSEEERWGEGQRGRGRGGRGGEEGGGEVEGWGGGGVGFLADFLRGTPVLFGLFKDWLSTPMISQCISPCLSPTAGLLFIYNIKRFTSLRPFLSYWVAFEACFSETKRRRVKGKKSLGCSLRWVYRGK